MYIVLRHAQSRNSCGVMSALACRILETGQVINQHLMVHTGQAKWALPISLMTNEVIITDDFAAFCEAHASNDLALPHRSEVGLHSYVPLLTLDGLLAYQDTVLHAMLSVSQ